MSDSPERKRRLLYGRRKGPKLSPHQQHLRDTLLPQLALKLKTGLDPIHYFSPPPVGEVDSLARSGKESGGGVSQPPTRLASSPTSPQGGGGFCVDDVWLEVGFGAGEHLLWQAQNHPRVGLIGAEPYEAGTNKLMSKLEQSCPRNLRLYEGDARDIIDALPDASLGRFFILFPDPWPKTRHHKRRFIQTAMLETLAAKLKPGAELRFATDDKSYLPYALERLMAHPAFEWTAQGIADWKTRPADWPQTRYEAKAIKGPPTFLSFRRKAG